MSASTGEWGSNRVNGSAGMDGRIERAWELDRELGYLAAVTSARQPAHQDR
ncbi:hypothetical protein GCM10023176_27120 [Micromonospora coerulea]|uniref:Uncharacterized protein n=1 Tax=Micromonospora coerulea TaxID=47856 RepID=A0ABP8SLN3_9ACTN